MVGEYASIIQWTVALRFDHLEPGRTRRYGGTPTVRTAIPIPTSTCGQVADSAQLGEMALFPGPIACVLVITRLGDMAQISSTKSPATFR